jgi:AcrR family transcriptional regulator
VQLEVVLLDAAWDELTAKGYGGFAMDSVAERADTSRPVLYRRWRGKDDLIKAALSHAIRRNPPPADPDTGSLRGDMIALMRDLAATHRELVTAIGLHLSEYVSSLDAPDGQLQRFLAPERAQVLDVILRRAVERGEADPDKLTDRICRLPFDLLRMEMLLRRTPIADDEITEIVDTVFLPLVALPPRGLV